MALTFTRALVQPVTAQTINSAATYSSAEQDIGDATIATQIWAYLSVAGFAAAPTGNMIVYICGIHTTAGHIFDDSAVGFPFTVAADQLYEFAIPLVSLPRYWAALVKNNTNQNTDASAVDAWVEMEKVTA